MGKCNEESPPSEIYSGDIIQFGVDVTENNRKSNEKQTFFFFWFSFLHEKRCLATHNCIIIEVKLYHSDGSEALPRTSNGQSLAPIKELDVSSQTLYQLAQYLQVKPTKNQNIRIIMKNLFV